MSRNESEVPMRGAAQIENTINKSKNYTNNISMWTMSGGQRTILQVTKSTAFHVKFLVNASKNPLPLKSKLANRQQWKALFANAKQYWKGGVGE